MPRHRLALAAALAATLALAPLPAAAAAAGPPAAPSEASAAARLADARRALAGFDAWMEETRRAWNAPGIGVALVVGDEVVLAKGYGYRDYGEKLPFTARTVVPIASNTKLFTAVAAGTLVEEGRLGWDEPIRRWVPEIEFHDDRLAAQVSLRDMLAHRTGITRHDTIWYKSDFTRRELFERLKYLEPKEPIRTLFLYNNMMYAGVGHVVERLSGRTWEQLVQERIFDPLGMTSSNFTIDDLTAAPDHGVPYTERRDSDELYAIPYYREAAGVGPAGSINSNLEDLAKWLRALLHEGRLGERQVLPAAVLAETLAPAIAMPNAQLAARGWGENLNAAYGMGRWTSSYRGRRLAFHGGDINGFHSQVAIAPDDGFGLAVLVIGDHAAPLYNVVMYELVERLTGMAPRTDWSGRYLEIRQKGKAAGAAGRAQAGAERVADTRPAHPLAAYAGEYEHPAYGVLRIAEQDGALGFDFHGIRLPLAHFHFERFDTPDDEEDGKWSVNFATSPQGEVATATMSLDEGEAIFRRRAAADLSAPATLARYVGTYASPTGARFAVVLREDGAFGVQFAGAPFQALLAWQPHRFRVPEFADVVIEFVLEGDRVVAMKQRDPSGETTFPRQE
ncbi:MAG: serine hydrolase [Thermoanaerobaculia bacterium]|nr:serine hydrolase [Thermoanaerobaculia bacterium]